MAAPWRRCNRPLLEAQPWTHLKAADGQDLLVKGLFQEDGYHVMLCDLENVWEESVESEDISGRSKVVSQRGLYMVRVSVLTCAFCRP